MNSGGGARARVRVSGSTEVSSVGSTEVLSRLMPFESTDAVVRTLSGLDSIGGAVTDLGALGMVVSTGPEAEGGMVLMTFVGE